MTFSSNTSKNITQDTTVLITATQLREANLIFLEHRKLLVENDLLNKQLDNYSLYINNLEFTDSLRSEQLNEYSNMIKAYDQEILNLNTEIRRQSKLVKVWKIGGITVSAGLLIFLLLK